MSEQSFVMVPTEITLDMQHAYFKVIDENMDRVQTDCTFGRYRSQQQAYREMLKAAPVCESDSEQQKQLQSKIAALSIAVADNDIDEVKRLLPLSGEQVVREIQAEAVLSAMHYADMDTSTKDAWIGRIQQYWHQLRNPEQEKV